MESFEKYVYEQDIVRYNPKLLSIDGHEEECLLYKYKNKLKVGVLVIDNGPYDRRFAIFDCSNFLEFQDEDSIDKHCQQFSKKILDFTKETIYQEIDAPYKNRLQKDVPPYNIDLSKGITIKELNISVKHLNNVFYLLVNHNIVYCNKCMEYVICFYNYFSRTFFRWIKKKINQI